MKISVNSSKKLRHFESIFTLFFFAIILELRLFAKLASLRQKKRNLAKKNRKIGSGMTLFWGNDAFSGAKEEWQLEKALWRSDALAKWRVEVTLVRHSDPYPVVFDSARSVFLCMCIQGFKTTKVHVCSGKSIWLNLSDAKSGWSKKFLSKHRINLSLIQFWAS